MLHQQEMQQSYTSSLLMTHARFAELYSLFESVVEKLPEALTLEFVRDVDQIRGKLDSWKALFTYEKEKVNFLTKKDRRKSFSDIQSLQESTNYRMTEGSCDCSIESGSITPTSALRPPSTESTVATPPPSTPPLIREQSQNDVQTKQNEKLSAITDTLPLILDNENDETWLCSLPQDALTAVKEESHKPIGDTEANSRSVNKVSSKKIITDKIKSSADWIRTKIPKAKSRSSSSSVLWNLRSRGSPGASSISSPSRSMLSASGRLSVEISTQSESRGQRFRFAERKVRNTTV